MPTPLPQRSSLPVQSRRKPFLSLGTSSFAMTEKHIVQNRGEGIVSDLAEGGGIEDLRIKLHKESEDD
jgi:hypothetical protein